MTLAGWRDLPCPECGAQAGEDCFEKSRLWGRMPPRDGQEHQARIKAVLDANRETMSDRAWDMAGKEST